jgi:hypothetical protein
VKTILGPPAPGPRPEPPRRRTGRRGLREVATEQPSAPTGFYRLLGHAAA